MNRRWCNPRDPRRPAICRPSAAPAVFRPGGVPGGGLFPFSNSAPRPTTPMVANTPAVVPPPPNPNACKDTLSLVTFSVNSPGIQPISGGGAALVGALVGAPPGTTLLITDSLNYNSITINGKTNLTIMADVGQTPSITAPPGNNFHCVTLGTGNDGIAFRGITFIGNGNAGPPPGPGQATQGLINYNNGAGGLKRLIVEDCTFIEPDATVTQGAPGIWLRGNLGAPAHQNISIHRCTFINTAMSLTATDIAESGACAIGGFQDVWIQNCWIRRTTNVLPRNQSPMRGLVLKVGNGIIEDVLCDDLGTGGQCQSFLTPAGPSYGSIFGTMTFRNCISFNGRFGFAIAIANSTMVLHQCVYYSNLAGITATAVYLNTVGVLTYYDSVSYGAGDGFAFTPDPLGSPINEDHNCIFNFGTNGRTLDPSDVAVNPQFEDPANGDYVALAAALQHAARDGGAVGVRYPGGEKIIYCNH